MLFLAAFLVQLVAPSSLAPTLPVMALDQPDWALRRAPGSCATQVALGHGAHLLLAYDARGDRSFIALVDPALRLRVGDRREATLRVEDVGEGLTATVTNVSDSDRTPMLTLPWGRFSGRLRGLAEMGGFSLALDDRPPVMRQVQGARDGVARLLACAEEARAALPPAERVRRVSLASYFTAQDYPIESLRNDEQGTVRFALTISAEGRVTDCTIIQTSGSLRLDETTCRLVRERLRFQPARDREGRPIPFHDTDYSLTWRLPVQP